MLFVKFVINWYILYSLESNAYGEMSGLVLLNCITKYFTALRKMAFWTCQIPLMCSVHITCSSHVWSVTSTLFLKAGTIILYSLKVGSPLTSCG